MQPLDPSWELREAVRTHPYTSSFSEVPGWGLLLWVKPVAITPHALQFNTGNRRVNFELMLARLTELWERDHPTA